MSNIKVLAYYLPQFHPTPENNEWWGKGFTEWVNVAKARPLFKGHKQPHIPADLGFYDLRLPESRALQAEYAKRAGISAFCYWHYWFGNGKRLLNLPFDEVVRLGEPDFPFCLAWANHSWYAKLWTTDKGMFNISKSKLLMEQKYPGKEDYILHFKTMLPAFQDKRYFRIDGKLVFVIYAPQDIPNINEFFDCWNTLASEYSLGGFYFIAHCYVAELLDKIRSMGFDAINFSMHHEAFPNVAADHSNLFSTIRTGIRRRIQIKPKTMEYSKLIERMDTPMWDEQNIYPTLIPNWDHTPRSGNFGRVFLNSTPELFGKHVDLTLKHLLNKEEKDQVVFIKSWNEWGEGNYLEPDIEYGTRYLEELYKVLKSYE